MIDEQVFAHQMGILADRIGRPLAAPTLQQYHASLSRRLSDAEFVAATTLAFDKCRWWLTVDEFVELVHAQTPIALRANEAYNAVVRAVGSCYDRNEIRWDRLNALDAVAVRAFRATGGFRTFDNLQLTDEPFVRRRFVEAYEAAAAHAETQEAAALALTEADPRVRELIAGTANARSLPARVPQRAIPPTAG